MFPPPRATRQQGSSARQPALLLRCRQLDDLTPSSPASSVWRYLLFHLLLTDADEHRAPRSNYRTSVGYNSCIVKCAANHLAGWKKDLECLMAQKNLWNLCFEIQSEGAELIDVQIIWLSLSAVDKQSSFIRTFTADDILPKKQPRAHHLTRQDFRILPAVPSLTPTAAAPHPFQAADNKLVNGREAFTRRSPSPVINLSMLLKRSTGHQSCVTSLLLPFLLSYSAAVCRALHLLASA